jgi:hypothetical protein
VIRISVRVIVSFAETFLQENEMARLSQSRRLPTQALVIAAVYLLVLASVAAAQDMGSNPSGEKSPFASVPHPKPPAEVVRLGTLIGTWTAEEHWEKVEGFAPGGDGVGVYTVTDGPGSMSIVIDYKAISGPFPTYTGHGILSWELDQKLYRMAWAQPIWPGVSIETGRFEGPDLILSYEIVEMGKKYVVRNAYSEWTPNSLTITSHLIDLDGSKINTLTMKLKKRP